MIGRRPSFWGQLGRYQRTRTLSAQLPEDRPGLPVDRLARRLLAEAAASPALVSRTGAPAKLTPKPPADRFPTMALLSDPALDIQQYLEDLVSIAVKSAQQAEDVSLQAQDASKRARRGMAVVAGLGAVGLLVGAAGFAASRSSNIRLSELRDQVGTLQDMQRDAQQQLGDIATRAAATEQRDAEDATPRSSIAPAAVVAQPLSPPTPATQRTPRYYSEPWPDSRSQPRQGAAVQVAPVGHRQAVVVPQFFADISHNLRAIFR